VNGSCKEDKTAFCGGERSREGKNPNQEVQKKSPGKTGVLNDCGGTIFSRRNQKEVNLRWECTAPKRVGKGKGRQGHSLTGEGGEQKGRGS